ncbi:DUF3618 domain-containing protein [Clavibacter sepedonicus]|nr:MULTISPECIES: DUF3618 domain-containing protein [Clavibacter]MBD5381196.1 DUF3618 domain-containing protein [Clavibacter sp.]UUK64241.1 DUF3618 domain-containing protein [Clavibacter sepedonicus]
MAKKKSPSGEVSVLGAVTTVAREVRKHKTVAESAPEGQGAHIPPAPKRSPEELKRDIQTGRDELARTVRELETALDVAARASELKADASARARAIRDDVTSHVRTTAHDVSRRTRAFTRKDPAVAASIGAGAVAVVLAVGAAVVSGGRR